MASKNASFSFTKEEKQQWNSIFYFLNDRNNWAVLFLIFISAILNFISIFYLKTIIDKVLPYKQVDMLYKVVLFFFGFLFESLFKILSSKFILKNYKLKKNNIYLTNS